MKIINTGKKILTFENIREAIMETYSEITFEELLKYKERLVDSGTWAIIDLDEKKEINEVLERKLEEKG